MANEKLGTATVSCYNGKSASFVDGLEDELNWKLRRNEGQAAVDLPVCGTIVSRPDEIRLTGPEAGADTIVVREVLIPGPEDQWPTEFKVFRVEGNGKGWEEIGVIPRESAAEIFRRVGNKIEQWKKSVAGK